MNRLSNTVVRLASVEENARYESANSWGSGLILEHLRNWWSVLAKLRRVLRDDGVLIATIPNLASLRVVRLILRDRFEYASSGTLDRTHLRFFTLNTIRSMFAESGFEITRVERKLRRGFFHRYAGVWSLGYIREGGVSKFSIVARRGVNS